jgi:hypothetical protein
MKTHAHTTFEKISSRLFKPTLLLAYFLTVSEPAAQRVRDLDASPKVFLFLILFFLIAGSIIATAYIKNGFIRWTYAVLLSSCGIFTNSVEWSGDTDMTYDLFITLVNSSGFLGEAAAHFSRQIELAAAIGILLMIGIGAPPRIKNSSMSTNSFLVTLPIFSLVLLTAMLYLRGGEGARAMPAPYHSLGYAALFAYELSTSTLGPRVPLQFPPPATPLEQDLVLVVDESVAANYLDIVNTKSGIESGLLVHLPNANVYNYGVSASISNCSEPTNLTLRHGGTRGEFRRYNETMPFIWQYAKQAGLKTVYIDGQRTKKRLQNGMNTQELQYIDEFVQFDDVPVRDRDMAIADEIAKRLRNDVHEFIYVNKVGAHFPVHDKYPSEYMHFKPVAERGHNENISDKSVKVGEGSTSDWQVYRNSYRNTLLWNVGAFFQRLFAKSDLSKATIIYTSDHGQDLHERGNGGMRTHCSSIPLMEEGAVPLVVINSKQLKTIQWEENYRKNYSHTSHYQIFPTLLLIMGFDVQRITDLYGQSIIEESKDPITFNARFNARLGVPPLWLRVEAAELAMPPNDGLIQ